MKKITGVYESLLFEALELKPWQMKRIKCDSPKDQQKYYVGLSRAKKRLGDYPILENIKVSQYTERFNRETHYFVEITKCVAGGLEDEFQNPTIVESEILPPDAFRMAQLMKEGLEEGSNTPEEIRAGIDAQENFNDLVKAKMRVYVFGGKEYEQ